MRGVADAEASASVTSSRRRPTAATARYPQRRPRLRRPAPRPRHHRSTAPGRSGAASSPSSAAPSGSSRSRRRAVRHPDRRWPQHTTGAHRDHPRGRRGAGVLHRPDPGPRHPRTTLPDLGVDDRPSTSSASWSMTRPLDRGRHLRRRRRRPRPPRARRRAGLRGPMPRPAGIPPTSCSRASSSCSASSVPWRSSSRASSS